MKKVLILSALGIVSTAALAGGASTPTMYNTAPTTSVKNADTGIYIEGLAGYNQTALKDTYGTVDNYEWNHGTGNWALGADAGYQFNQNMAAELGGIYTFNATQKPEDTSNGGTKATYQPWYGYLAGKLSLPVYDNLSVFTKLGVGYQHLSVKFEDLNTGDSDTVSGSKWAPMFGFGAAYNFTPSMYITGEWLRFTGKIDMNSTDTDSISTLSAPNIFLVGLGYKFAM
jgi:opacity protein-like surface antigen